MRRNEDLKHEGTFGKNKDYIVLDYLDEHFEELNTKQRSLVTRIFSQFDIFFREGQKLKEAKTHTFFMLQLRREFIDRADHLRLKGFDESYVSRIKCYFTAKTRDAVRNHRVKLGIK